MLNRVQILIIFMATNYNTIPSMVITANSLTITTPCLANFTAKILFKMKYWQGVNLGDCQYLIRH